jgi:hypothetical protein
VGGGFFAYQLWWEPLSTRDRRITELSREKEEKAKLVQDIVARNKEHEKFRAISLPAGPSTTTIETDLARREYEEQLNSILRSSGYEAGTFSIIPKPVDMRSAPAHANKKPIYARLAFTVQAKGDLLSFVEFLEKLYKLPLLHKVNNISIQRPLSGARGANELDTVLTIEALVLDNAEKRKTLLPERKTDVPVALATQTRTYPAIAGKDMFYGPPAPPPAPTVRRSDVDFKQFITFVSVTDGESGVEALLYDRYSAQETSIRPRKDGSGYRVEVSYMLSGRRRLLRSGRLIEILDENSELQHRWSVVKLTDRDLYLQDEDYTYVLHLGQKLSEMTKLSSEEIQSLGLAPKKK